jgi:outer membrane biosynthesis protein TonB
MQTDKNGGPHFFGDGPDAVDGESAGARRAQSDYKNPAPPYPEVAKKFGLTGIVKVHVVIAADGHIKSVRPIGGHPVLVDSVKETLKDWKYAPASSETTTVLEFDFHP